MKKSAKIILIVTLSLAVVIGFALLTAMFLQRNDSPQELRNGAELYNTAAKAVTGSNELSYCVKEVRTFSDCRNTYVIGSNKRVYTERSTPRHYTRQISTYGQHQISTEELYIDEKMYLTVNGARFISEIKADDFQSRTPPPLLITPSLYATVQAYEQPDGILIRFTDATALEPWFTLKNVQLLHANATAALNTDGSLRHCSYQVTYRIDNTVVRHFYAVNNIAQSTIPIPAPDSETVYTPIDNPDAVLALEQTSGYLLSSVSVDSRYRDQIYCQVFGDIREQQILVRIHAQDTWSAQLETTVAIRNDSQTTTPTALLQTERFQEGCYTISKDGAPSVPDPTVTATRMQDHCQDILVGTIPLPNHVESASLLHTRHVVQIEYNLSESFARSLAEEVCLLLYDNPGVLSDYQDTYVTDYAISELLMDPVTGIPISSSLRYRGTYSIDGVTHALVYTAEQTYA